MSEQKHMKCCPSCQSDQIKKASLVYAENVGIAAGGMVGSAGVNVGAGASMSGLALKAAPPKKQQNYGASTYLLGAVWLFPIFYRLDHGGINTFWGWWGGIGFLIIMVILGLKGSKEEKVHKQAMAEYEKVFMCLRCGTFYKPYED